MSLLVLVSTFDALAPALEHCDGRPKNEAEYASFRTEDPSMLSAIDSPANKIDQQHGNNTDGTKSIASESSKLGPRSGGENDFF